MTGAGMISTFKIYYDRITSFSAPGYEDSEILTFLNNAQDEFVKERTFGKNFQPPAFDDNEKRVADIQPLVQTISDAGVDAVQYGNATKILYTDNPRILYLNNVWIEITRTYPTVSAEYVECDRIQLKDHAKFISNDQNKVHFISPKYFILNDEIIIVADTYTNDIATANVRLNAVLKPYPITAGIAEYDPAQDAAGYMSLHPSVHQEIVDIAVRQALQAIQDPRWQSKVQEEQIKNE